MCAVVFFPETDMQQWQEAKDRGLGWGGLGWRGQAHLNHNAPVNDVADTRSRLRSRLTNCKRVNLTRYDTYASCNVRRTSMIVMV